MSENLVEMVRILVGASQLLVAAIVGFAAVSFYRWQKTAKDRDSYVSAIHNYHNINLLVIGNPELQDIESENHFVGSGLSRKEIRKMFFYFEQLNSIGRVLKNSPDGLIVPEEDQGVYFVSSVKNIAKCIYKDREFIRRNCFPRGYTKAFVDFMNKQWEEAEQELRDNGYLEAEKGERSE